MALAKPLARLPLVLILAPIALGLGHTLTTAGPFADLLQHPGLWRAVALSLGPGLAATLIATGLTVLILAHVPPDARLFRLLPLGLALPHAALALGLALLIAPSGLIARVLAPLMGWEAPPDLMTLQDRWGIGLTLGLVLKETPFLLFLALAARTPAIARRVEVAATLGQGRMARMIRVEWPALYPSLRLPILAVLTYGMTTVDMGAILGPGLPAPLSVEVTRAALRPDLGGAGLAASLALLQLGLNGLALLIWRGVERLAAAAPIPPDAAPLAQMALALLALPLICLALLAVLSQGGRWPFPDLVPHVAPQLPAGLWALGLTTLTLALAAALAALALALVALQAPASRLEALIWLPLILPQVAFLPGLARGLIPLGLGPWPLTLMAHIVLVFPYVWLVIAGPWRALPAPLTLAARSLGAGGLRLALLRLGLMRPALAAALAVGVAASVGQYLATLLISGGRIATLTTEAVALASGPDRALVAGLALAQAALPLLAFALAARVKAFPSPGQSRKRTP